ncbi:protein phosphatase [Mycoplasmopsis californica HAZ160_1]|uniref:Protein phosphatase n=2 Tax=Mycoplasmopsis californica TaxID=2113 RepID=A0A059XQP6_9BACT|nr:protein phosphatase 2C domain-containing protein [Mycoplasmopsis californica]AIA29345.1 protein phosphatase [Mycoplasmopsis californica]BAP01199.1 protein phosphatase [Mycoplasmopsis californica HAZ160_1]BBG41070.1 protein phosphatase [Mycoplasmopsis californica]BBG41663.1 protein phosphatase [Mycoplasmopsis californica]BBG42257.1 protein phosphatase [Mycoplasmopsis californica]
MSSFGELSSVGNIRSENQDRVGHFLSGSIGMILVCDGMGGHFGGAYASSITVNVFNRNFKEQIPLQKNDINSYATWFKKCVEQARAEMKKMGENDEAKLDMGTTVTAAIFDTKAKFLYIFNIGDSRTYVLSNLGELTQITVDHNLLNKLILIDNMSEMEAKKVRYHTALTSALGPQKKTKIEVFDLSDSFDKVHGILSTSDGVHDFIEKPVIEQILRQEKNEQKVVEALVQNALDNKSTDNASAVYVTIANNAEWRG